MLGSRSAVVELSGLAHYGRIGRFLVGYGFPRVYGQPDGDQSRDGNANAQSDSPNQRREQPDVLAGRPLGNHSTAKSFPKGSKPVLRDDD